MANEVATEKPVTEKEEKIYPLKTEEAPVSKQMSVGSLKYTVEVGMLPIQDEFGAVEGGIAYTAYFKEGVKDVAKRPIMFTFNGGPGSSSVWLHLGAVGPRRVKLQANGEMPAPPYELEENPQTWLEHADLVFIDPVGTGFSRPKKKEFEDKFFGLKGDIDSVSEFITRFLSRYHRWKSPLYLVGESYGTTRAAGLAGNLVRQGVAFNGIILVSSILNLQTARFMKGNDLPYALFLPTFAATAWFHGVANKGKKLSDVLKDAEAFAAGEYSEALAEGDALSERKKAAVMTKLAAMTGLSKEYLNQTDLRINIHRFCKELLRNDKRTVGRLDARFKGIDSTSANEMPEHDPASSAILPPYTACINDYLRREIGYQTDMPYFVSNPHGLWASWNWGDAGKGYPDTSESLREAMSKNPYMKIFIASGYYDLATPYFATDYTVKHMGLDTALRDNITTGFYEAGHMMYIDEKCLAQLKEDIAAFMKASQ